MAKSERKIGVDNGAPEMGTGEFLPFDAKRLNLVMLKAREQRAEEELKRIRDEIARLESGNS